MNGYEKFAELLKEKGVKSKDFSEETGIAHSTLSDWKRGISVPKMDKMKKIADYFCVDLGVFIEGVKPADPADPPVTLTDREKHLLESFSLLSDEMQYRYLDLIETTAKALQKKP